MGNCANPMDPYGPMDSCTHGPHATPPINFLIQGTITNSTTEAPSVTAATVPKRVAMGIAPRKPAAQQAILLPAAVAQTNTPIIKPTIRTGESFVTTLSPTGLRHSSPTSVIA